MQAEDTGPLYGRIGELIAAASEDPNRRILLLVAYDRGVITETLIEDRGSFLYGRWAPQDLPDAIRALWKAQEAPDKWVEMAYLMENGRFTATLYYADQIDPGEDAFDRAKRIAIEVLGDKPLKGEPPPPPGDGGRTFEL